MSKPNSLTNQNDDYKEINFSALFNILWSGKYVIVFTAFIIAAATVFYVLQLPNIYRSDILLAPTNSENGVGGLTSRLGGLASLAGVSLPSGGTDKTAIGIEVLKSRKFFSEFAEKYDIALPLYASTGWQKANNKMIIDSDIYDVTQNAWLMDDSNGGTLEPTQQELHLLFLEKLTVINNSENGLVKIEFEHYSPNFAKETLLNLVNEVNQIVKLRDIEKAQRSIKYLEQQLEGNKIAELQSGLFDLIQSQTETIMLAQASPEYLFQIIDPPVASEKKVSPRRGVICILGALAGLFVGISLVLFRAFVKTLNKSPNLASETI